MEKINPDSGWNDKPTPGQVTCITKYRTILRIREPLEDGPQNRLEARNLIYQLKKRVEGKPKH